MIRSLITALLCLFILRLVGFDLNDAELPEGY
jgi:hypothetical protein